MKNTDAFWERHALPFPSLIYQVLTSQNYTLIEENEVFPSFPIYIEPSYPMLKSLGVVCDQDEDTSIENAFLNSATINCELQTIHSTLHHLDDQMTLDLLGHVECIEHNS